MEKRLSGIKDLDREIMLKMDDQTLLNFCQTSQYARELCDNDLFWQKRVTQQYPRLVSIKQENYSWRQYYLYLTYWTSKLREEYDYVSDDFYGVPEMYYYLFRMTETDLEKPPREVEQRILNDRFQRASFEGFIDLVKYLAEEGAFDYQEAISIAKNVETIKTLIRLAKEENIGLDYRRALRSQDILNRTNADYLESLL